MNFKSKALWIDSIFATIFVFALMWGFSKVFNSNLFDEFDSIGKALSDMEITDMAFSRFREPLPPDENIVLVNIGDKTRGEIGMMVNIINQYNPKVVAFDTFFAKRSEDTLQDEILSMALANIENLVLVTQLLQTDSLSKKAYGNDLLFDSLKITHPFIKGNKAHEGFANLSTDAEFQDDFKTCREFPPSRLVRGDSLHAFAVKISEIYNPEATNKLLERSNDWELINYRGNFLNPFDQNEFSTRFYTLDWDNVFNEDFEKEVIEGKIVLFGYLGDNILDTSWDDKFFSPLNKNYAGKANPDMYGLVIHANIVSMILNGDYIDSLSEFLKIFLAILLCYINIVLFSYIFHNLGAWYDGISKIIQLVEIMVITFIVIEVFAVASFKMELDLGIFAIALAGDALEIYYGVIKNLFSKKSRRELFTFGKK